MKNRTPCTKDDLDNQPIEWDYGTPTEKDERVRDKTWEILNNS